MARLTPHALAQSAPAQTQVARPSDNRADVKRRMERIRREEAWASRTTDRYTRQTMAGRYGVRL